MWEDHEDIYTWPPGRRLPINRHAFIKDYETTFLDEESRLNEKQMEAFREVMQQEIDRKVMNAIAGEPMKTGTLAKSTEPVEAPKPDTCNDSEAFGIF